MRAEAENVDGRVGSVPGPPEPKPAPRKLLVLDSAFCLEAIRARGLEASVTCRDLGGYFEHVWSVHPMASLVSSRAWGPEFGAPDQYELSAKHTLIEGKVGRFSWLRRLPPLNFLVAQADVMAQLARLIETEHISVIRAGDPLYLGLLAWTLSRKTHIPFIVRVGGNNTKVREVTGRPVMPRLFRWGRLEEWVESFVLRRADLVAGANEDNLQFAVKSGAASTKATLFRYGNLLHPAHFAEPSARPWPSGVLPGSRFMLYVGRLEPVKHADDVVRVLADMRRRGHDVDALLVGDGTQRAEIERLARDLEVADHVKLCGNKDQEWLASAFAHAEVVLSPHTGRALSEAALGAAAIAGYDVDWQSEVLKPGTTGELVPFGDWEALSASAHRLLADRAYASRLGAGARTLVREMMDPERLDAHERDQYGRLLAECQTHARHPRPRMSAAEFVHTEKPRQPRSP